MQDIVLEVIYFIFAGGWGGLLALLLGVLAGILAVRGSRRAKPNLVNWGLAISLIALLAGILGMITGFAKVSAFVAAQIEQGVTNEVAAGIRELGNWESYVALFWGLVGLMPGLWIWLAKRGKQT